MDPTAAGWCHCSEVEVVATEMRNPSFKSASASEPVFHHQKELVAKITFKSDLDLASEPQIRQRRY
jgi:hypothetical protein